MAGRPTGPANQVVDTAVQRTADQGLLVLRGPLTTEPGHHCVLDLEPERLGVDEQPVQAQHHGVEPAAASRGCHHGLTSVAPRWGRISPAVARSASIET